MDTRTGVIKTLEEFKSELSLQEILENVVAINDSELTDRQLKTHNVSLFDNRSVLGKKFTEARKNRMPRSERKKRSRRQRARPKLTK